MNGYYFSATNTFNYLFNKATFLITVNNTFVGGFILDHVEVNHVQSRFFLETKLIYGGLRLLF